MTLSTTELKQSFPFDGQVQEIWIRPDKFETPVNVNRALATIDDGLAGDHYSGSSRKRQITLIQYEHLSVIASLINIPELDAGLLRRNIVVSGINLQSLKECIFSVGTVHLHMTGLCHPCSRMEKNLGPGGYNAVRGHGGINATVIRDGEIKTGDRVSVINFN